MVGLVALALLVYRRTGSALGATAFFLSAQFVPALISPMAVARLDHRPPRPRASGSSTGSRRSCSSSLAWVASPHFSLVVVLALALLDGIVALTARSLARAATVA